MRSEVSANIATHWLSKMTLLGAAFVACLALQACLKRGPGEADLIAVLMEVQSERPSGAPDAIQLQAHECSLMNHGQAYECNVEFVPTRDGAPGLPRKAYLIVSGTDDGWRLISHEPKN
jgi:hypothetical protein